MTPNYYSTFTPLPPELKEDQLMINQPQLFNLNQPSAPSASSSYPSAASYRSYFELVQEQGGCYHREPHQPQQPEEAKMFVSQMLGSCDHPTVMNESTDSAGHKLSIWKNAQDRNENQGENSPSMKWMSSKMRLMKKMMNSEAAAATNTPNNCSQRLEDQKQPSSSSLETDNNGCNNSYSTNNNPNTIRVCADCHTTKTPLWRSGPRGPKSLCNACGIRQRKARRAMAAAAAAANGTILAADASSSKKSKMQSKDKTLSNNSCLPFKKRSKFTSPSRGKKKQELCFEDLTIILSKNSAYQRVFPQDEKEAAILLMALSYGLVQG